MSGRGNAVVSEVLVVSDEVLEVSGGSVTVGTGVTEVSEERVSGLLFSVTSVSVISVSPVLPLFSSYEIQKNTIKDTITAATIFNINSDSRFLIIKALKVNQTVQGPGIM